MLPNLTRNQVMLTASYLVMVHIIIVIVIVNLLLALLLIWCSTTCQEICLPSAAVRVGEKHLLPSSTVHDLGILIDSDVIVTLRSHMFCTMSGCVLCYNNSVALDVQCLLFHSLIMLVMPHFDYRSATLAGLPACQLCRLVHVTTGL